MAKYKRIGLIHPRGEDGKPVYLYQDPKTKEVMMGNVEPVVEWQRTHKKMPKIPVLVDKGDVIEEGDDTASDITEKEAGTWGGD